MRKLLLGGVAAGVVYLAYREKPDTMKRLIGKVSHGIQARLEEGSDTLQSMNGRHSPGMRQYGEGARDLVDEESWESFPASDPPANY